LNEQRRHIVKANNSLLESAADPRPIHRDNNISKGKYISFQTLQVRCWPVLRRVPTQPPQTHVVAPQEADAVRGIDEATALEREAHVKVD